MSKKFSELDRAVSLNNGDLLALAQVDEEAETGYKSAAAPISDMAQKILKEISFPADLNTDTKNIIGAINELDEEISDVYTKEEIDNIVNLTSVASGAVASFNTTVDAPLISVKANVTGTETGTGERTPNNPYVITFYNEVVLNHYADDVADADVLTFNLGGNYYLGELLITDKGDGTASVKFIGKYKKITIDNSTLTNVGWYAPLLQLAINNVLSDALYDANKATYTCDKLVPRPNSARSQHVGNYIALIGSGTGIAVSIPNCNTEESARAFFTDNSLTFCYELATPVEINFPDISSIMAFEGANNLFANSGDVEVEYKKSIIDFGHDVDEELDNFEQEIQGYVDEKTKHKLEIKTFKRASSNSPDATSKPLCFLCGKWINKQGEVPDYTGYLFVDDDTGKFYYTSDLSLEPQYLFDWDSSLVNNENHKTYVPTITADGDVIFLKDHVRHNPIVYPHGDYANPYEVDFGSSKKPYAWLVSSSVIQFDDGSFCFGDYAYHSLEDEQNDDRRIIWRVTKPYSNPANWVQAHSFKHVYYTSPQSNEPDNEIGHIHALLYDFYADDLYCTTGDIDRHCRMWISTDKGITWSAVPGAVGTTEDTTRSAAGQKWRMTNGVFTEDAIWWGTDAAKPYHRLWKCIRDLSGHINFDTLTEVIDLEVPELPNNYSQRTYITALMRNPDGLLLIDRGEPRPDKLDLKFYDFESKTLETVITFKRATTDASTLEQSDRIGVCQQATTVYQPQTLYGIITGGGKVVRPNVTSEFNNSKTNYIGALIMRLK